MTPANITAPGTDPSATSMRATIDALLQTRLALERALVAHGLARAVQVAAAIDAFCATSSTSGVTGESVVKAQADLAALKKTFDDQEPAFHAWEEEINGRLEQLSKECWDDVQAALDAIIGALKQRSADKQGDVDAVSNEMNEFTQLRTELQSKRYPSTATPARKTQTSKGDASS